MRRPSSFPVLIQVAALAVLAVVMSQAVAFGVLVLAPEPRPAGFSIEAAAEALQGQPAETSDGRAAASQFVDRPPGPDRSPPMTPSAWRSAVSAPAGGGAGSASGVSIDHSGRPRAAPRW